jgi:D-2-hydroxyacid dehydrogenase (NADP+)
MEGSCKEHLSTYAVTFLLAFARHFDFYLAQKRWQRGPTMVHLPDTTVLIVGVGGSGREASKQCAAFGMRVLGCDPRTAEPAPGMAELFTPDTLPDRISEADFVLVTVPESPDTVGMFNASLFSRVKQGWQWAKRRVMTLATSHFCTISARVQS